METTEGAESLAADSGGFTVRNSNDLAAGLKRIADETRAYYLIGYNPTNTAHDGAFRKIEVKVRGRRGLEVRARKGYYAPSDPARRARRPRPGTDPVFQAALDSPYELEDIPLRMTHVVREETTLDRGARVPGRGGGRPRPRLRWRRTASPRARCSTCWWRCSARAGSSSASTRRWT